MSYLVLARKWRPQNFSDVVGQQPVVRTLQNALNRDRVAHAMLFSGVRGVGKTTLARLMAKALNCQVGEPDTPCNQCDSCKEITAGTAIDLQEIDGASNRGIQEIRELKENIRFFPTKNRYKVIIIDEVHMLTTEAFNALLKTLEEPPAHVYFMFATTELHKIPVTILSRCQRYELRRVPFAELVGFFKKIAAAEGVSISDQALAMIAGEAEGSIRDGLSLLDQIFSFGGAEVTDADVTQVLGLVDRQVFAMLAEAMLAGDLARCLALFAKSNAHGIDLKRFANDLLAYFRALLICKVCAQPEELLDVADTELARLKTIAGAAGVETLYHYFHLLLKGVEEMHYSSRPRMALEMAFIKAAQAGQITPVAELLGRLDQVLGSGGALAGELQQQRPAAAAGGGKPMPAPGTAATLGPDSEMAAQNPAAAAEKKTEPDEPREIEARQIEAQEAPAASSPPAAASTMQPQQKEVRRHWEDFIDYVKARKNWMAQVLRLCAAARQEGAELVLKFDELSDCKVLQEPENIKYLTEFSQDYFQKELKVRIAVRGQGSTDSVNGDGAGPQEERRALANDPLVQMAAEIFNGQVVAIRTGPRSR